MVFMKAFWHSFFYEPIYNALIALVVILPGHSVGLAIVALTIMVKSALLPLTAKTSKAQAAMKDLEPELKALKEKHGNDREAVARATMELYQKKGVNPLSGCLPVFIQLPIIIALYFVFSRGLSVNTEILYSFIPPPPTLDYVFLGVDLTAKSLILAIFAGLTQFAVAHLTIKAPALTPPKEPGKEPSFQEDLQRSMQMQMKYVLPVMIGFFAYSISAAVALYWTVGNMVSIAQELYLRGRRRKQS